MFCYIFHECNTDKLTKNVSYPDWHIFCYIINKQFRIFSLFDIVGPFLPVSLQIILQIVSFIKALYVLIPKISKHMKKVLMRIPKGITEMLKRIRSLRGMETKQKCVVQRDEIIIPSTKNNDSIYLPPQVFTCGFFIYRRLELRFFCYFLCSPSAR